MLAAEAMMPLMDWVQQIKHVGCAELLGALSGRAAMKGAGRTGGDRLLSRATEVP